MFTSANWKGITGGIGLIVYAILGVILKSIVPDSGFGTDIASAIPIFLAGLGILGIRLKQG